MRSSSIHDHAALAALERGKAQFSECKYRSDSGLSKARTVLGPYREDDGEAVAQRVGADADQVRGGAGKKASKYMRYCSPVVQRPPDQADHAILGRNLYAGFMPSEPHPLGRTLVRCTTATAGAKTRQNRVERPCEDRLASHGPIAYDVQKEA